MDEPRRSLGWTLLACILVTVVTWLTLNGGRELYKDWAFLHLSLGQ